MYGCTVAIIFWFFGGDDDATDAVDCCGWLLKFCIDGGKIGSGILDGDVLILSWKIINFYELNIFLELLS